jgi:geranylgeranyl pyrophosphate synthase
MGSCCLSTNVSFHTAIQEEIREVEERIRSQADGYHPDIAAALDLLLSSGGKRLRPTVTILAGHMLDAPTDRLITLAAAIELLHTATLVHDDLIDGSLLRRGNPTLNSQWSPGATVLTGDFLFSCAAKLASETESVPVIQLFSQTLITIVNGEITQLFSSRSRISREGYFNRIYAKTASLLETSAKAAALIGPEPDDETVEDMRQFGYQIGMAFQIVDDILDFTSDAKVLGKPVGSDVRQGIVTLPTLIYGEIYPQDPDLRAILESEHMIGEEQVSRLVKSIRESAAIDLAFEQAAEFVQGGLARLRKQPESPERQSLEELAEFIVQRKM